MVPLRPGQLGLQEMHVHFIAVEIRVVRFTVSVVEPNCLLFWQDFYLEIKRITLLYAPLSKACAATAAC